MKYLIKVILALSVIVTLTVSEMSVSAYNTGWNGYDINDTQYIECVDTFGGYMSNTKMEDILVRGYNAEHGYFPEDESEKENVQYQYQWLCKHIMGSTDKITVDEDGYVIYETNIELGRPNDYELSNGKSRTFANAIINMNWFKDNNAINIKDVQALFNEKQFNAKAEYCNSGEQYGQYDYVHITYGTNITSDEICEILSALNEKFELLPSVTVPDYNANMIYTENNDKVKATLKGDANLDGSVDLADLTVVAKYNLSNEAYPLENETAYANADMNGDGVVDGLDTSALIENQLGK